MPHDHLSWRGLMARRKVSVTSTRLFARPTQALPITNAPTIKPRENSERPSWNIDEDNLCSQCVGIIRAALRLEYDPLKCWEELEHHKSITNLEASAEVKNCGLCRKIISAYPESEIENFPNGRGSPIRARIGWFDKECLCWVLQVSAANDQLLENDGAILYLLLGDEKFNSPFFSPSTRDPSTLDLAKSWFTDCCLNHSSCKPKRPSTYPKRILSIHHGEPIHLWKPPVIDLNYPPYATLSHCWGSSRPLVLTSESLGDFLLEIPKSRLPKTFQDAIDMARFFGLMYLWIDSLCIVQDDPREWQQESMKMADIYQGSKLNISATGANNGSIGLFFTRNSEDIQSIQRLRVPLLSNTENKKLNIDVYAGDIYKAGIEDSPIASRGWCLQERFLAPRTLHFARSQIFWDCQEDKRCETFPDFIPYVYRPKRLRPSVVNTSAPNIGQARILEWNMRESRPYQNPESLRLDQRNGQHSNASSIAEIWAQCVGMYSRTQVTLHSDKLVAISGVARWIHKKKARRGKRDVYLVGLWRENLLSQLLWRVLGPGKAECGARCEYQYHSAKPTQYMAPSWSWASTNKFIEYRPACNIFNYDDETCKWSKLTRIVEAKTELRTKGADFGQVVGGSLHMRFTELFSWDVSADVRSPGMIDEIVYWDYDIDEERTVYVLPIFQACDSLDSELCGREGLLLEEVPGTTRPQFKRLGCYFTQVCLRRIGRKVEDLSRFKATVKGVRGYYLTII